MACCPGLIINDTFTLKKMSLQYKLLCGFPKNYGHLATHKLPNVFFFLILFFFFLKAYYVPVVVAVFHLQPIFHNKFTDR